MELWKFHHKHFTSVFQSNLKDIRTRFDPVLMNRGISLLANTSESIYNDIVKVMKIPSSSWVMRNAKDLIGKQGITGDLGINVFTIQTMKENPIGSYSNIINGSLFFDDMYMN